MTADITGKSTEDYEKKENECHLSLNIMADIKASEILPLVSEKANLFTGNLKVSSSDLEKLKKVLQVLKERKLTHKLDMGEIRKEKITGKVLTIRIGSPALTKIEEESLMKEMKASSISILTAISNEFSGIYKLDYDDDETANAILDMQKNDSKLKFLDRKISIARFKDSIITKSSKNESKKRKIK